MLLSHATKLFLEDRTVRGSSKQTLRFYDYVLRHFLQYVHAEADHLQVPLDTIGQYLNSYFLSRMEDTTLSQRTHHAHFRGLRAFAAFVTEEGYVMHPIKLPKIRLGEPTVKAMSPKQMGIILRSVGGDGFLPLRNQAIIRLLIDTGIRLSEVTRIEKHHIDWDHRFIFIQGKGDKERYVPFGKETKKILWNYTKQREKYVAEGELFLFITRHGFKLTSDGLATFFERLKNKIKMEGVRISAHTFRHSFSLAYIENGGDPYSLQNILGHTTQHMTSKYVRMAKQNIKHQHDKYSPGDRII